MKFLPGLLALAFMFATSTAMAGPSVTIVVKNQSMQDITYSITDSNETTTYANASPKPKATILAGESNTYIVTSTISPDVNYAYVRYQTGFKTCIFKTTYVNMLQPRGGKIPQWNKDATGLNGATCAATITSTNPSSHGWVVEFVMK